MIVECSTCHTKYNVDDRKIPPAGVKVRCQKCQNVIIIKKETPVAAEPAVKPAPVQPPPVMPPVEPPPVQQPEPPPAESPPVQQPEPPPVAPPEEKIETESYVTVPKAAEPPPVQPPPVEPPPVAPPEEKIETESYVTVPRAAEPPPVAAEKPAAEPAPLSDDDKRWHERARRLAKALASDLVLYNQDKVEQGLREGTLVDLLGSEIRRSWEYYCQQIPKHIVQSTDFFKEQLNKIVCKGREIFK